MRYYLSLVPRAIYTGVVVMVQIIMVSIMRVMVMMAMMKVVKMMVVVMTVMVMAVRIMSRRWWRWWWWQWWPSFIIEHLHSRPCSGYFLYLTSVHLHNNSVKHVQLSKACKTLILKMQKLAQNLLWVFHCDKVIWGTEARRGSSVIHHQPQTLLRALCVYSSLTKRIGTMVRFTPGYLSLC